MPERNGTGPMGLGEMTGRGQGVGHRMKPGYGCRRGSVGSNEPTISKEREKEMLKTQISILQQRIETLDKQL